MKAKTMTDRMRARRGRASVAVLAVVAAPLAWSEPSGAEVAEVRGGAFGHRVSVSVDGGAPVTSGPAPAVTTAPAGGSARDAAPSVAVGRADATGPFRGSYLRTGLLTASTWGTTGRTGSLTTSATTGAVDALGGALTASRVTSACVADESGPEASVTIESGRLAVSATETVDLPASPAPGTGLTATTASGERFTFVLNEQQTVDGTLVVNAVRVVLEGPTASGEIVLAQTRCGVATATAAPEPVATTAVGPATPAPPAPDAPAASAPPPGDTAAASASSATAATAVTAASEPAAPAPPAPDPSVGVRAAAGALQEVTVASVTGSAYGVYAKVSLFGGDPVTVGPVAAVSLPAGGSSTPVTGGAPAGAVAVGPAQLFQYDAISTRTQGTTGVNGSVTTSAKVTGGTDDPPGPVIAKSLASSCMATATKVSGTATITDGILETKYGTSGPTRGEPIATEPIPTNPAPNTERTGKLDHIGDSWRVVFNEQITEPDGTLTVNAFHLYLLGPVGVGDLIVGQSRCGLKTAAVEATTTSTAPAFTAAVGTAGGAAATGSGSTGGGTLAPASVAGDAAATGAAAGSATGAGASRSATGTAVAGASQSRRAAGGGALALTGGTAPRLLSFALLGAALVLARLRRHPGDEPPPRT